MTTIGFLRVFGKVLNPGNKFVNDESGRVEMLSQSVTEDKPVKQAGCKISFGRAGEFDADYDGWVSVEDIIPAWFS